MDSRKMIAALGLVAGLGLAASGPAFSQEATVIELTQTGCQFLEPENGEDHGFKTAKKADCVAINKQNAEQRLAAAKPLELKPGKYIFRVKNRDVPYPLGFWLRGEGLLARATLPSVSGGGLTPGKTLDYEIELEEGDYLFSCPLNTTPDYKLSVKG